jgi:putative ABC transport system permease protein
MRWWKEVRRRLAVLRHRDRFDREIAEEMQRHLEMQAEEYRAGGLPQDDARLAARRQFGNGAAIQERSREAWGWRWLEDLARDVRFALRTFRLNRSFAAVAITTLALGIGVNAAIFSVLYGTCLAPLPYAAPDRLVDVRMARRSGDPLAAGTSLPNLRDWRDWNRSFEGLAASSQDFFVNLTGDGEAEETQAWKLSSGLLPLVGVHPLAGRWFAPEEDLAGGPHSALISYGLWQNRFGGRADALDRQVFVDGQAYQIVGIMPPRFDFPPLIDWKPSIWLSLNLPADDANARDMHSLFITGRLKPGVSIRQAQAEMEGITNRLAQAYPKEDGAWPAASIQPMSEQYIRDFRSVLWMLSGAAGLVLLIACANVAGLLLARGSAREREFAVRRALGVSSARLVRQLLTEGCVLAAAGGSAGVLLAYLSLPLLKPLLEGQPRADEIAIRPAVLAFAAGLAALTGLAFGLAPALRSAVTLRAASARPRLRRALIASEIALATVLTAGAGLLIESFWRATHVDLGFQPDSMLTMRVNLPKRNYDSGRKVEAFREELLRRVAALPGVEFAGTNSAPPMGVVSSGTEIEVEGAPPVHREIWPDFANVSADYLRAMRIPILRGRDFEPADRAGTSPVAIVSALAARLYFGGQEPLGKRIRLSRDGLPDWFAVVGIAGDVRQNRPESEPEGTVYVLSAQLPEAAQGGRLGRFIIVAMRTSADSRSLARAARAAVASIDKDQPVADVFTMSQIVERRLAGRRLNTLLIGLFAALAMGISAVGIFGLVSYSVARRTHEIGVRVALGAHRLSVLGTVSRAMLAPGAVGIACGLAGALASSRLLASLVYGVKPAAPHILFLAAGSLACATAAATFLAARRAMRIDPVAALRHE